MVATRRKSSLAATSIEPQEDPTQTQTPPTGDNKRANNALKKLHVEGTEALVGAKPEKEEVETYVFRGAVYVKTKDTPQEWLEQEPERYRKRKRQSMAEANAEKNDQREEGEKEVVKPSKRKRAHEDEQISSVPRAKRARLSTAKVGNAEKTPNTNIAKRDAATLAVRQARSSLRYELSQTAGDKRPRTSIDGAAGEEDGSSPKRQRRNQPAQYYGRPKRSPRKRKERSDDGELEEMNKRLKTKDFTVQGGRQELSNQQMRDIAAARGFQVDMIPRQEISRKIQIDITDLGKLNSQIERLEKEHNATKATLMRVMERRKQASISQAADEEHVIAGSEPPPPLSDSSRWLQPARARTDSPKPSHPRGLQQETPISHVSPTSVVSAVGSDARARSSSVEIITERRDSGAPMTPRSDPPPLDSDSADPFKPPRPGMPLPTVNKAGQRVRWSLSEHVTDVTRAEEQIYRGRMEGESESAKRRRVARELELVRCWKVVEAGGEI